MLGGDTTKSPSPTKADSAWEQLCSGSVWKGRKQGSRDEKLECEGTHILHSDPLMGPAALGRLL